MGKQKKKGNYKEDAHYNKLNEYMYRMSEEEYIHTRQELAFLLKFFIIISLGILFLALFLSIVQG
ncbi:MAG: hypothetical protein ACI4GW_13855 [Lachnospiraceae bacterium]